MITLLASLSLCLECQKSLIEELQPRQNEFQEKVFEFDKDDDVHYFYYLGLWKAYDEVLHRVSLCDDREVETDSVPHAGGD